MSSATHIINDRGETLFLPGLAPKLFEHLLLEGSQRAIQRAWAFRHEKHVLQGKDPALEMVSFGKRVLRRRGYPSYPATQSGRP